MRGRITSFILCALFFSALVSLPIYAKNPSFMARGTIDAYMDVWSSEIVMGSWRVKLEDGNIEYEAIYVERNLDEDIEDSPMDSTDTFWHSFTAEGYELEGDNLQFWGTLHVEKLWSKMDGSKEFVSWDSYPVRITLDSKSFYLDVQPLGPGLGWYDQDWDRAGRTVEINR